jgi:hypothetical protein
MPISKKGTRGIYLDGRRFRWRCDGDLVVRPEDRPHRALTVRGSWNHHNTPCEVSACIKEALLLGWLADDCPAMDLDHRLVPAECLGYGGFPPEAVGRWLGWLAWNRGAALALGRSIWVEGQTDLYPILADALEEAACTETKLLAWYRSGREESLSPWYSPGTNVGRKDGFLRMLLKRAEPGRLG